MISKACDLLILLLFSFFLTKPTFASQNSFVSVVNPIRGGDFWENKDQKIDTAVLGEAEILKKFNVKTTWLIRYDAILDEGIINKLNTFSSDEKGLFLEVTPTWTKDAGVEYHKGNSWHSAGSAFLTGYDLREREKLIDTSFEKFKRIFGIYPKSVGAWWVDSYSLSYMQKKYAILASLIVADQYTTDNYQIWGQYFSTPYYPSKNNALHPAQSLENKLPIVMVQWAPRDPLNSYGNGVEESTYSLQANDYIDYHNLNTKYFSKLLDLYTKQPLNKFSHIVVGLENSYSWQKYSSEYENQIKTLANRRDLGQVFLVSLEDFANWYKFAFPDFSPEQIIVADDSLGSYKKVVWFMNTYYRAGWFLNQDGSVFRDIRQYIDGEEELCYKVRCDSVNFATSATRVLDEVSFGHKLVVDQGKISDFNIRKSEENYVINYKNEAGYLRTIKFLPRDISIDGKISSIDGIILKTQIQLDKQKEQFYLKRGSFKWSVQSATLNFIKFLGFLVLGCLIPGLLALKKVLPKNAPFMQRNTLALILGFISITLLFFILSILKLKQFIFIYPLVNLLILLKFRNKILFNFSIKLKDKFSLLVIGLISIGTIFQQIPVFKNGLNFPYGTGFWGPNTHDGIWHISLINQLIKGVPPQNPIFANGILKNYHYFYDLLIATTNYISGIPILDLLFRFYPTIFSIILGITTYYLIKSIFNITNNLESKLTILASLYLVYFSGSFGWIVEYITQRHLGGESAFWANQSISFNLNPPFAISLIIVIAILQLLPNIKSKMSIMILTILAGSLISFKAYAAILILASLLLVGVIKRSTPYLLGFFTSMIISVILFLYNFSIGKELIIFSPFWFIHSMIDSPDRVGWTRLSLARVAGFEQKNWFKFLSAEAISLFIFIVGNLGTRVFALLSLIILKNITRNTQTLFILIFSSLALLIPILFIQAGNPWNTIQFIYYFLYISAVCGGYFFAKIVNRVGKVFALPIIVIFILITPINSWASANGYLSYQPHALISNQELEALNFLKSQEDGVILTYPYDKNLKAKIAEPWPFFAYDSTAYISAFSNKAVFLEDEPQNDILLTDYKNRLLLSKDFFVNSEIVGTKFLTDNNIKYIYLPKIYNLTLVSDKFKIKQIYENSEILIYMVE